MTLIVNNDPKINTAILNDASRSLLLRAFTLKVYKKDSQENNLQ